MPAISIPVNKVIQVSLLVDGANKTTLSLDSSSRNLAALYLWDHARVGTEVVFDHPHAGITE